MEKLLKETVALDSSLSEYLRSLGDESPLSEEEEQLIAYKILEGDKEAITKLVTSNLRLVVFLAGKFMHAGVDILDLIQDGNIGLMKAAEKYDVTKGYKFCTYASYWINQYIRRGIMNKSKCVRLPIHVQEKSYKLSKLCDDNCSSAFEKYSDKELSDISGYNISMIRSIKGAPSDITSLNKKVGENKDTYLELLIRDELADSPEEELFKKDMCNEIKDILNMLPQKEREILELRCGLTDGRTYSFRELSDKYNLSRERIRQIESKAIKDLKENGLAMERLRDLW